jgi:hypothetical protein
MIDMTLVEMDRIADCSSVEAERFLTKPFDTEVLHTAGLGRHDPSQTTMT